MQEQEDRAGRTSRRSNTTQGLMRMVTLPRAPQTPISIPTAPAWSSSIARMFSCAIRMGGRAIAALAGRGNRTDRTTVVRSTDACERWITTVPGSGALSRKRVSSCRVKSGLGDHRVNLVITAFKFFVQFVFYTALFCTVTLAATALSLKGMLDEGLPMPGDLVAILAIAGFFGLFTFSMTLTAVRYAFINLTNVDVVKQKSIVHQLAIRIPRDTPPRAGYSTITYPLPQPPHVAQNDGLSPRDMLATRSYAIVRTDMGENPWDLGAYRNWKSVMGNSPLDWFLPIKMSPCVSHESNESFYEMGPLYYQLRARYGLPEPPDRQTERPR